MKGADAGEVMHI